MSDYPPPPMPRGDEPYPAHGATPAGPLRRPGTVTAACVLTWVFSAIALIGSVIQALAITGGRDEVIAELEKNEDWETIQDQMDVNAADFVDAMGVFLWVVAALSLLAILLAVFTFRGGRGARVGLVVLSAITALIALLLSVAIIPFLWVIVCVTTIVLLFVGGAGAWFASKGAR